MKRNQQHIIWGLLAFVFAFASCEESENWSNHYAEEKQGQTHESFWNKLKGMPEYSEFYQAALEYKIDTLLDENFLYTFFLPTNEKFDLESIDEGNRYRSLLCHIMEGKCTTSIVEGRKQMKSGKYMDIVKDGTAISILDQGALNLEKCDQDLGKIMVHEMDTILRYLPNTYEYLTENSVYFNQYLQASVVTYADIENSTWTGEFNEDGQKTYDTLYAETNTFLRDVLDITNEESNFTVIMPDASTIDGEFEDKMLTYYGDLDNIPAVDYRKVFDQILQECIFYNKYYSDEIPSRMISALGNEIEIDATQLVSKDVAMSNGILHTSAEPFTIDETSFLKHVPFALKSIYEQGTFPTAISDESIGFKSNSNGLLIWKYDPKTHNEQEWIEFTLDNGGGWLMTDYDLYMENGSDWSKLYITVSVSGEGVEGGSVTTEPFLYGDYKSKAKLLSFTNTAFAPVTVRITIVEAPSKKYHDYYLRLKKVYFAPQSKNQSDPETDPVVE